MSSLLRVERLCRITANRTGFGWLASCRYCPPPLDRVPFQAQTWLQAAAVLEKHLEEKHPEIYTDHTDRKAAA